MGSNFNIQKKNIINLYIGTSVFQNLHQKRRHDNLLFLINVSVTSYFNCIPVFICFILVQTDVPNGQTIYGSKKRNLLILLTNSVFPLSCFNKDLLLCVTRCNTAVACKYGSFIFMSFNASLWTCEHDYSCIIVS